MKLVISRKKWLRGEGSAESYLLRVDDRKMCCIGIYLNELGVDVSELEGNGSACNIADRRGINFLPEEARWLVNIPLKNGNRSAHNTSIAADLMHINDEKQNLTTEDKREQRIKELFAIQGIEVEFV